MFLNRIHLNLRCREARRDLSDPYQLHSTLCRAFSGPTQKCTPGAFLWRLESERDVTGEARVLIQSRTLPDWSGIGVQGWMAHIDPAIDLNERLQLDSLRATQKFRFRLRANPSVTRNGKRLGLLRQEEQEAWLERKGARHGFSVNTQPDGDLWAPAQERIDVRISQERMAKGRQHFGNHIRVFSVLFDGVLIVSDPDLFRETLRSGIGHGKTMGLGLMSVLPVR